MMCIVTSEKDIASLNVWEILSMASSQKIGTFDGNPLLKIGKHVLLKTKKDTIFSDNVAKINADIYIFASRHSSETKKPCLSAHATGNFDEKAVYGGEPKELGVCAADLIGSAIRTMETTCPSGFEVSMEVTHHGPTSIRKPMMFIEVGSSEVEWNNIGACRIIADTILNLKSEQRKVAIGFGGGHYAPAFKSMVLKGWNIGHICPKYRLDNLDHELFSQMVEKTSPKPEVAILDRRGMKSSQMKDVKELCDEFGIKGVVT